MINNLHIPTIIGSNKLAEKEKQRKCCFYAYPVLVCYDVTKKLPIPLRKVQYNLKVMKGLTCVEIEQTYSTMDIDHPIDIEYLFVINKNAAVSKMIVQLGDNKVIGVINEKEEAKQQYEEGIKQGKTMAYCEEEEDFPEIKRIKIGQLAPQKQLKVIFEYIQPLDVCFNKFFKVDVSPLIDENYVKQEKYQEKDLFNYIGKYVKLKQIQYNFTQDFKVSINTGSKITFIKSPTHSLLLMNGKEQLQDSLLIELEQSPNNFQPNKQFTLLFSTDDINLPTAILTHTNNDALQYQKYCATLTFVPKFNEIPLDDACQQYVDNLNFGQNTNIKRGNYLFIIDRSGSMKGHNIERAKLSLILFLKSLPEESFFNIVSFGSGYSSLWSKSQEYNQQSLDLALTHVKSIDADMGGTEIRGTLQSVVYNSDYSIQNNQTLNVFLLTDGEDTPEPIIQLVKKNNKPQTRVYTIGIGEGCCQYLIKRIAEVGNGKYQFVSDTNDISEKVIDLLEDSITLYLEQFNVDSNAQNISSIIPNPESIVSLKKNQLLTIQMLFSGDQIQQNLQFQIGCFDPQEQKQVKYEVALNIKDSLENEYFHKLAIHKQIQYYENAEKNGDNQLKEIKGIQNQIQDSDIINLSVEHQILCSKTAFVCEICDIEDQFKQQTREKVIINQVKKYDQFYEYRQDEDVRQSPYYPMAPCMACAYSPRTPQMVCLSPPLSAQKQESDILLQIPQYPSYSPLYNQTPSQRSPSSLFTPHTPLQDKRQLLDDSDDDCMDMCQIANSHQAKIMSPPPPPPPQVQLQQCHEEFSGQTTQKALTLDEIIQFAQADGSFKFSGQIYIDQIENPMKLAPNVWSTIFALLYLEIKCHQNKNIWQLVYQKGVQFLSKNGIAYRDMKNLYFEQYKAVLEK